MKIPVLYGTFREGRKSEAVAKFIHAELLKRGIESEFIAPENYHGKQLEQKHLSAAQGYDQTNPSQS